MQDNENVLIVLDYFENNQLKKVSVNEILEDLAVSKKEILEGINFLVRIGVLDKDNSSYSVKKEIKAIQIASAAHYSVDLCHYKFLKIKDSEIQLALSLSNKIEEIQNNKEVNKWSLIQQRRGYINITPKDEIMANLFFLYEAANSSLFEYLKENFKDDEYLKVLIDLHKQAEEQLNLYSQKK